MLDARDTQLAMDALAHVTTAALESGDPAREAQAVAERYRIGRALLTDDSLRDGPTSARMSLDVRDPFPDVTGTPPEVGLGELDLGVLRGALAHHGCLIVHDFFSASAMTQLRDDIDQLAAGFDRWMASGQADTTPSYFEPFEAPDAILPLALRNMCGPLGTFYAADAPRAFVHMLEAFDSAGLPALLTQYMREPVLLGLEKTAVRRVPPGVPTAWHQDGIRFGHDVGLVNVWVPLSPCGVDAPTLGIVPKRLDAILPLDEGSAVPWEIRPDALAEATAGVAPIELVLDAGDAILFDEMLVHSTITHEGMTARRYCADAWFFPVSRFPADLYKPLAYAVR
jgi:hypothetical protein